MGASPPLSDQSLGAYMMRLRDPKTGQPLPDERLLPHIGMICKLPKPSLNPREQLCAGLSPCLASPADSGMCYMSQA